MKSKATDFWSARTTQTNSHPSDDNILQPHHMPKIVQAKSSIKGCKPQHIFSDDDKQIWMSLPGLPQSLIIDIGSIQKRVIDNSVQISQFGFRCSNVYSSNPSKIVLRTSIDGSKF